MKDYLPVRKENRLKEYDYSNNGIYFITMCIKNRLELFGKIIEDNIKLTEEGKISKYYIEQIHKIYNSVNIDEYIIMPNHIHMIIKVNENNLSISTIIKQYKMAVSKKLGYSIWQKSYYDHIIRNEKEYYMIKEYIQNNIINWKKDKYF